MFVVASSCVSTYIHMFIYIYIHICILVNTLLFFDTRHAIITHRGVMQEIASFCKSLNVFVCVGVCVCIHRTFFFFDRTHTITTRRGVTEGVAACAAAVIPSRETRKTIPPPRRPGCVAACCSVLYCVSVCSSVM